LAILQVSAETLECKTWAVDMATTRETGCKITWRRPSVCSMMTPQRLQAIRILITMKVVQELERRHQEEQQLVGTLEPECSALTTLAVMVETPSMIDEVAWEDRCHR